MQPFAFKIPKRYVLYHILAIIFVLISGGIILIDTYSKYDVAQKNEMLADASMIAVGFDQDRILKLSGTQEDLTNPDYLFLKNKLVKIRAANDDMRFAYLVGYRDGRPFFFADSEPDGSPDSSPPGQIYREARQSFVSPFFTGKPIVEGIYPDRWGTWLTALSPIFDPVDPGKVIAEVGIDVDASNRFLELLIPSSPVIFLSILTIVLIVIDLILKRRNLYSQIDRANNDALLASIGDGVIAIDKDSKIIFFNKKVTDMLGFSGQDMIGNDVYEVIRIEDEERNLMPKAARPFFIASSTAVTVTTTITKGASYFFSRKDGTRIPIAITASPILINDGVVGAIGVFRDISDEKEIDRQKSEFVSLVSHQLRTPLGSMRWNLEILESKVRLMPKMMKERLHDALKSNLRLIQLVGDFLDVTRIEQGRINNEPELVDVTEAVKSAAEEIRFEADSKSITIGIKIKEKDIPKIMIDKKLFREVIQNLLSNAVKYTLKKGSVSVEVDFKNDSVEIAVSDSGIGIPEKDKSRIFTKFARAQNAARIDMEGSGLGLFIVKSFLDEWGGKVRFESEENKGTTFYVSLPITQKQS